MGEVPGLVKVLFPSSHLCSQLLPLLNLSLHSSLRTHLWNSSSSPGFHSRPRVNMVCMDQTAPFPLTISSTQAPAAPYGAHLSLLPVLLDLISSSPEGEFIPFPRQGSSVSWPLLSKTVMRSMISHSETFAEHFAFQGSSPSQRRRDSGFCSSSSPYCKTCQRAV